jgi:phosphoglucomutase
MGPAKGERSAAGRKRGVKRLPFETALKADTTHEEDFVIPYVKDLKNIVDMDAIRAAGKEMLGKK